MSDLSCASADPNVVFRNWFKLAVLLNRATVVLRRVFLRRWKWLSQGEEWVNCRKTGIQFILGVGKHIYNEIHKDAQRKIIESGDVTQWDLSTLALVLQDKALVGCETENGTHQRRLIHQLCWVRNKVFHHPTMIIPDDEFNILWQDAAQALVALGDSAEELDHLKFAERSSTNLFVAAILTLIFVMFYFLKIW